MDTNCYWQDGYRRVVETVNDIIYLWKKQTYTTIIRE